MVRLDIEAMRELQTLPPKMKRNRCIYDLLALITVHQPTHLLLGMAVEVFSKYYTPIGMTANYAEFEMFIHSMEVGSYLTVAYNKKGFPTAINVRRSAATREVLKWPACMVPITVCNDSGCRHSDTCQVFELGQILQQHATASPARR